jgi:hypothetical protein
MLARVPLRVLGILLMALSSACSHTLHLALPSTASVQLVIWIENPATPEAKPKKTLLPPSAPEYRRLQEWLAHNQSGWSQSYATNPSGGVLVHAGDLHLQFINTTVFAFTAGGQYQKEIREEDYAFLKAKVGI